MTSPEVRRKRAAYSARQRDKLRPIHRAIIEDFLSRPCVDCGECYPLPAMQPDHIKPKVYKVSWFKDGNGSTKRLMAELERCVVRCANCHCIRHAADRDRLAA